MYGRAVGRFRAEDAYLVKLLDNACRCLAVASPDGGKLDLGSYELPWL